MKLARWFSTIFFLVPCLAFGSETLASALNSNEGVTEVSPVEDLMREHGVLQRILLIYDELGKRLASNTSFAPRLLSDSALIVQKFIENYHEKLEEDFVFPRLEKREETKELVKTLFDQHKAGRLLTAYIIEHSTASDIQDKDQNAALRTHLEQFCAMYRPHAAREDTVAFPYFKTLISEQDYLFLIDVFENKEKLLFGEEGFSKIVNEVATIEKALGIYTLRVR